MSTASNENTDFAIPTIVHGYVSVELDPVATSGDGFRMALHDTGSGSNAMQIIHTELGWPVIAHDNWLRRIGDIPDRGA